MSRKAYYIDFYIVVFVIKRELLNDEINIALDIFECLNQKLTKDKSFLIEYFEELRVCFIKILNKLAQYYVFHHPAKISYEGDYMIYENSS